MSNQQQQLVKIKVDLPHRKKTTAESFWAKPLGGDLYELRNSPWYAFDLHFYDLVRAVPTQPGELPTIVEVVQRSGHKTLRVFFTEAVSESDRRTMLAELHQWKAFHENANGRLYAVDVEPDGDYQAVCDQLWAWQQEGRLFYETGMTKAGDQEGID
jgi:hypothetical protein